MDSEKTRNQLIEELSALRARVAQLESSSPAALSSDPMTPDVAERYQRVLEKLPVIVFSAEAGTNRFLVYEGDAERLLGYPASAFMADPDFGTSIIHPADTANVLKAFEEGLASRKPFEIEFRVLHGADGREIWVHESIVPVYDGNGTLLRQDGVATDITFLKQAQIDLKRHEHDLELLVRERSDELIAANKELRKEVAQRLGAEEKLREVEARLRLAMAAADMGTWRWESETGLDTRDANLNRILGLDARESAQPVDDFIDRIHPEDRGAAREAIHTAIREHRIYEMEFRMVRPDGSIRWVHDRGTTFYDDQQRFSHMTGVVMDITDRREALESFRRSESRFRDLLDQITDGIAVHDMDGRIQFVNNQFVRQTGYSREELLGMFVWDLEMDWGTPEDIKPVYLAASVDKLRTLEGLHRRKDGTTYPVELRLMAAELEGEKCVIAIARDVSEQKEMSDRLRLLSCAVEQSSEGIAITDCDGHLQFLNEAFAEAHGYHAQELLGKHLSVFHAPEQMPAVDTILQDLAKNNSFNGEVWHCRRDGEVFPAMMCVSLVSDEAGVAFAMAATLRDITEYKRVENALLREKRIGDTVIDTAMDGFNLVDPVGKILRPNDALCEMLGYSKEELEGMPISRFEAVESPEETARHIAHVMKVGGDRFESRYRRKDGQEIDVEISIRYAKDIEPSVFFSFNRDITQRKQAESRMRRLIEAVESAGEGIGLCDDSGRLSYANEVFTEIFGSVNIEELNRHGWITRVKAEEDWWEEALSVVRDSGRYETLASTTQLSGRVIPLAVTLKRVGGPGENPQIVVNLRDRTVEEDYVSRIRKMTFDATRILEQERTLISRELHDELGQLLTAMRMSLGWLKRRELDAEPEIVERIAHSHELAGRMIDVVRNLARNLRPPILEHEGLVDAIRSHMAAFRRSSGIACELVAEPPDLVVAEPLVTVVYRVVQEALTNISRHAQASHCRVYLKAADGRLDVRIQDDGVGAGPEAFSGPHALGVTGMRERAIGAGGTFEIGNAEQGGVYVAIHLPLIR